MGFGHLHALEVLLVSTCDRTSFCNILPLPGCWRGCFALVGAVDAKDLPGCPLNGGVFLASCVPCVGWKGAVGIWHQAHRSMLLFSKRLPRHVEEDLLEDPPSDTEDGEEDMYGRSSLVACELGETW